MSKMYSATKGECVPAFVLFTLMPRDSEIVGLIGALLQQPSFAERKQILCHSDTDRVKMCKMASTTEAIFKAGKRPQDP